MNRLRRAFPLLAVAALPPYAVGCSPKPIGQIVIVVQTDMSIPKDIDTIRIEVANNGAIKFQNDYANIGPDKNSQVQLPGTISLVASGNPSDVATITVSARSAGIDGTVRIVRRVVTTIPDQRTVTLNLGLHFLCYGQAMMDTTGDASGTCADGQSCIGGECQGDTVDASTLTDYDPKSVDQNGSCFDGASCWNSPTVATVDLSTCTIPPVSGVNIALQTETLGICGPSGCFITLDQNDPTEGYTVGSDGRIHLPPGVCSQLASKQIINVVTQPIGGGNCAQKQLSVPTCGPWSSSANNPPVYTGPQALVSGQARPVTLAVQAGTQDDTLYWTNGGAGSTGGSLRSVTSGGGTPSSIASSASAAPRSLIALGNKLYWTDAPGTAASGSIFEWDGSKQTTLVDKLDSPEGITALTNSTGTVRLFWTDFQDGAVYTSVLDGTGISAKLVSGANYPFRVAADDTYVYYTEEGTAGMTDGKVSRYPYMVATGVIEPVATGQATPRSIAIDSSQKTASAVYFATFSATGSITRVKVGGTTPATPEVLAANQSYPNGLVVSGGYIYWTNRGDGTVNRLSTGAAPGTAPKVLATGQLAPGSLSVGGSFIYWVNEGSSSAATGGVIKLPLDQ